VTGLVTAVAVASSYENTKHCAFVILFAVGYNRCVIMLCSVWQFGNIAHVKYVIYFVKVRTVSCNTVTISYQEHPTGGPVEHVGLYHTGDPVEHVGLSHTGDSVKHVGF
jgi:hypothetical protein